jgi:hypothetical protein
VAQLGDVVLFDYQIMHRGGPNMSDELRSMMYVTYSRDWYKDSSWIQFHYPSDKAEDDQLKDISPQGFGALKRTQLLRKLRYMTQKTRFGEPASASCGSGKSLEECLAPPASADGDGDGDDLKAPLVPVVPLEDIRQFLPDMQINNEKSASDSDDCDPATDPECEVETEEFIISNVDVEFHDGEETSIGVDIYDLSPSLNNPEDEYGHLTTLGPYESVDIEAEVGATIEARRPRPSSSNSNGDESSDESIVIKSWKVLDGQGQLLLTTANSNIHIAAKKTEEKDVNKQGDNTAPQESKVPEL